MARSIGEFHLIRIHPTGKYSALICYIGRLVRRASWDGVLAPSVARSWPSPQRVALGFRWVGCRFDRDVVLTPKSPVPSRVVDRSDSLIIFFARVKSCVLWSKSSVFNIPLTRFRRIQRTVPFKNFLPQAHGRPYCSSQTGRNSKPASCPMQAYRRHHQFVLRAS